MIVFQYFEGCPNSAATLENLKEATKELGISPKEINIMEVPDLEKAEEVDFQGSPTVLVDGIDIYSNSKPKGFNYTCRVYTFGAERTGILSSNFLRERLRQMRQP